MTYHIFTSRPVYCKVCRSECKHLQHLYCHLMLRHTPKKAA